MLLPDEICQRARDACTQPRAAWRGLSRSAQDVQPRMSVLTPATFASCAYSKQTVLRVKSKTSQFFIQAGQCRIMKRQRRKLLWRCAGKCHDAQCRLTLASRQNYLTKKPSDCESAPSAYRLLCAALNVSKAIDLLCLLVCNSILNFSVLCKRPCRPA